MPLTPDQLSPYQAMCQLPEQQQIGLVKNKALCSTETQPRIPTPGLGKQLSQSACHISVSSIPNTHTKRWGRLKTGGFLGSLTSLTNLTGKFRSQWETLSLKTEQTDEAAQEPAGTLAHCWLQSVNTLPFPDNDKTKKQKKICRTQCFPHCVTLKHGPWKPAQRTKWFLHV